MLTSVSLSNPDDKLKLVGPLNILRVLRASVVDIVKKPEHGDAESTEIARRKIEPAVTELFVRWEHARRLLL